MCFRFTSLACVAVVPFLLGTGLADEGSRGLTDDEGDKNWHAITQDERVSVSVERALYERPGQDRFFVQVRVTNRTQRRIGLALDYWKVLYPNQWGIHDLDHRVIVDEERDTPAKPTSERKAQMISAFTGDRLIPIPPHQSVTYFRDFNGTSGRNEVECKSREGRFLILSMDGQLFYTDGQSLHDVRCEWRGDFGPKNTDVVLKLPIVWKKLPKAARVIEDSVSE